MSWEYEIWQDERFIDSGDELTELERPEGARIILDASMVGSDEVDEAIAAAAEHRVQGLILSAATDTHGSALAAIPTLESLDLTHSSVSDTILPFLARLENLSSLALRSTQLQGPGLESLLGLRNLRVLDLSRTPLAAEALVLVGRMRTLKELWLDGTNVPGASLGSLAELRGLTRLGLAGVAIGTGQLSFLGELRSLQNLDLAGRGGEDSDDALDMDDPDHDDAEPRAGGADGRGDFGDQDLGVIGKLTGLRSLSVAGRRGIRGPGLKALAALESLEELDLSETAIEAKHLTSLATLPLVRLVLREVPLGPKSRGKAGYLALASCKSLAHLDLAGATLDDAAAEALADCTALEVLVLDHTPVAPKALKAFAGHGALQTVRFDGFRLDRDQAVTFGRKGRPPAGVKRRGARRPLAGLMEESPEEMDDSPEVPVRGAQEADRYGSELGGLLDPLGAPRVIDTDGLVVDAEEGDEEGEFDGEERAVPRSGRGEQDSAVVSRIQAALFGGERPGFGEDQAVAGDGAWDDAEEGPDLPGGGSEDAEVEAEKSARLLLARLVESGKVELVEGTKLEDFPEGLGAILAGGGRGEQKAARVTEWLLEQEDLVEEVYYSDDELGPVLDVW